MCIKRGGYGTRIIRTFKKTCHLQYICKKNI